jgi:integrase/recombinase XerD
MARSRLGEEHPPTVRFQSRQVSRKTLQSPLSTASCPPRDRDYELTVLFGILTERRDSFATLVRAISLMEVPGSKHLGLYVQDMQRRNCKPSSMVNAVQGIKLFLWFLKGIGKERIEEATRADLEAFVEHEQDRGLKLLSVRTYLAHVHAFLYFLIEEELIAPQILRRRIRLRLPQRLPRAIEPGDVKRLLDAVASTRDRAMVLVLLRTGMRIGEVLETRVGDVNLQERTITIPEGEKNRQGRIVYLSDDAQDALQQWLAQRDAGKVLLFYGQWGTSLTYNGARLIFRRALQRAGLAHKGYTIHCLRHTFASELLNAGMRLECLQQLLGHDSIEITRRYARLTNKTRREEYFQAMAIIEQGGIDGSYRLDSELQAIFKEKELLAAYRKELFA